MSTGPVLSSGQQKSKALLDKAREGREERLRDAARKGDEIVVPLSLGYMKSAWLPPGLKNFWRPEIN